MLSDFAEGLDALGAPVFVLPLGGPFKGKYRFPKGWTKFTADGNAGRLTKAKPGDGFAMVCGQVFDVIDVDPRNGGAESLAELVKEGLIPPVTYVVRTPSGGWHLYVAPLGVPKGTPLPGIDLQAAGSCVAIPGTEGYEVVPKPDWPDLGEQSPDAPDRLRVRLASRVPRLPSPARGQADLGEDSPATPGEREKATAVLAKAVREVENANGSRNSTVSRWLLLLYRFALAGAIDRERVDAALWAASQRAPGTEPYTRREFDASRESASAKAAAEGPERPRVSEGPEHTDDLRMAEYLAGEHLAGFIWAGGGWFRWTGTVWDEVTDVTVTEAVRRAVLDLLADASEKGDSSLAGSLSKLLSAARVRSLASLARGPLERDPSLFDADPWLLNTPTGVVDLRSGELLPHSPDRLITKTTAASYQPEATHADWTRALEALDEPEREWLQVWAGQAATGNMQPDDLLLIAQGSGSNGKTTVFGGLRAALGSYGVFVPEKLLTANPNDHSTELTTLQGARLALIEETPEARALSVKRLKDAVGTPWMTARRIRRDNVTWKATHTLALNTNYRPRIAETDHGTWRRLVLLTFTKTFEGERLDRSIRQRLVSGEDGRGEAVLAWIVRGAVKHANGASLDLTERMARDTEAWRRDSDVLHQYVTERLEFDPDSAILVSDLHPDFCNFLASNEMRAWSPVTFNDRLEGHHLAVKAGVTRKPVRTKGQTFSGHPSPIKSDTVRAWVGVRFKEDGR